MLECRICCQACIIVRIVRIRQRSGDLGEPPPARSHPASYALYVKKLSYLPALLCIACYDSFSGMGTSFRNGQHWWIAAVCRKGKAPLVSEDDQRTKPFQSSAREESRQ
jgi:hypothetical protein